MTITFPDAVIPPGTTSMNRAAYARFQVRVRDGVPAGTYTNTYLLTAAEGGPGISDTYLVCTTGTPVDADLNPVEKTVQGRFDADPIDAHGIGSTDADGEAEYVIHVANSGSVDIRDVVAYDILPRVGDTMTLPANGDARDSDFPVADVVVTDDLSDVLGNAEFGEFVDDDGGLATRDGDTITWNAGALAAGETRTVGYTVTMHADAKGVTIRNVVTGEGEVPPEDCTPEEPCATTRETPVPPAPTEPPATEPPRTEPPTSEPPASESPPPTEPPAAGHPLAVTGGAGPALLGGATLRDTVRYFRASARSSAISTIMSSWPPMERRRPTSTRMSRASRPHVSAARSVWGRKLEYAPA